MLRYSRGEELNILNGEGDTPLHVCARKCSPHLAEVILAHDPSLLIRENATGRTPFEIAEDAAIAAVCSQPPPMPEKYASFVRRERRFELTRAWNEDILSTEAETFVQDYDRDRRTESEKIWDRSRLWMLKVGRRGGSSRSMKLMRLSGALWRGRFELQKVAIPVVRPEGCTTL